MNAHLTRQRYVSDTVATASPARLLTMLYDRLVRDLLSAEQAIEARDPAEASRQLVHAQDILHELRCGLDLQAWDGAPMLAQLYAFMVSELIKANVKKDVAQVRSCRSLIEPLRDAWHEAALSAPAASRERSAAPA